MSRTAINIACNRRGPGTTQHYRSPKYSAVGSTLYPMLSGFPTSALEVRSGKNITQEPQLQPSDMKSVSFYSLTGLPLLIAGSTCCVNKQAGRPLCLYWLQRQWLRWWGAIIGCSRGCGCHGTQFNLLRASIT